MKQNRLFEEKESESKLRDAGLGVPAAEIPNAPNSTRMLLAPGAPSWLSSLAALLAESQDFPGIRGNVCFLVNWKMTARSYFAETSPELQSSGHCNPTGLRSGDMVCPMGHICWPRRHIPQPKWQVPSQNETISLADQSSVCPLLGFPSLENSWVGKKKSIYREANHCE